MISVITPVYNSEKYLSRCLDGILGQTYTDLEIILVDDGSPDVSGRICDEYAVRDNRVRIIHQANAGPSAARNRGLKEAKGEYIGFIDSDDCPESCMFQVLHGMLKDSAADIAVCNYFHQSIAKQAVMDHGYGRLYMAHGAIVSQYVSTYYAGCSIGFNSIWNKLYSAELIQRHQLAFDESRVRAEDAFFNLAACAHARNIAFTDQVLYKYYDNPESVMHAFLRPQLAFWERDIREALMLNDRWFHLTPDLNAFYRNIITQAANMMADAFILKREDRREVLDEFFTSDFFREVLRYDKNTPVYARIMCRAFRLRNKTLAGGLIRIYAFFKRLKHKRLPDYLQNKGNI